MVFLSRGVFCIGLSLLLQAPSGGPLAPAAEKPPLAWATVAIHASDPDEAGGNWGSGADGVNDRGVTLREVISEGYNFSVMPFREDEIVGLPEWAKSARYDIVARVDADDVEAYKKLSNMSMQETIATFAARKATGEMLMMQSLLRERFGLRAHWESKERSVYALVLAKGGLRLKAAADPKHGELSFARGHLEGKGVPLSFLGSLLAVPVGHTVVDRTGVTGVYDFDLHFDPRDNSGGAESNDPDLFTAVQQQLGLKLQSTHASVPVLVVDHVDPPTPN